MMKLGELTGQELKWIQPRAFKLEYELHSRSNVVTTLRYPRFFDTFAIASSGDETWTFRGGDFRQPTVSIRALEAETDLAVFKKNMWTGSGTLELLDGRKYRAIPTVVRGYRTNAYDFKTEMGATLVSYRKIWGPLHMSADVQIHQQAKDVVELPWIVMLVWHLALVL